MLERSWRHKVINNLENGKEKQNKLIDTLDLLWTTDNGPQFVTSLFKDYCEIIRLMEAHRRVIHRKLTERLKGEIRTGNQKF